MGVQTLRMKNFSAPFLATTQPSGKIISMTRFLLGYLADCSAITSVEKFGAVRRRKKKGFINEDREKVSAV